MSAVRHIISRSDDHYDGFFCGILLKNNIDVETHLKWLEENMSFNTDIK